MPSENNNAEIHISSDAGRIIVQLNFRNTCAMLRICVLRLMQRVLGKPITVNAFVCYIEFSRLNVINIYPFDIDIRFSYIPVVSRRKFVTRTLFSSRKIYFRQRRGIAAAPSVQFAFVCLLVYNWLEVSYITAFAFRARITKQLVRLDYWLLTETHKFNSNKRKICVCKGAKPTNHALSERIALHILSYILFLRTWEFHYR